MSVETLNRRLDQSGLILRDVYLHGRLGEKFGVHHRFKVATAAQAVKALSVNYKDFIAEFRDGSYELVRGDPDDSERALWLDLDMIADFKLGGADLHIMPHVAGSKNSGGVIKTVLGVAVIGAAIIGSGGTLAGLAAASFIPGMSYGSLALVGFGLALAGAADLLSKKPPTGKQTSYAISGPTNTYAQGAPVPLVFGHVIAGTVTVSSGVDVEQIPVGYDPTQGDTIVDTNNPEDGQGTNATAGQVSNYTGPVQSGQMGR